MQGEFPILQKSVGQGLVYRIRIKIGWTRAEKSKATVMVTVEGGDIAMLTFSQGGQRAGSFVDQSASSDPDVNYSNLKAKSQVSQAVSQVSSGQL